MKATIIENNARRNGEIIINGWDIDTSDVAIIGTEKQVAWCRDILNQTIGAEIERYGKAKGYMTRAGALHEDDWAKLHGELDGILAQIAAMLDGIDARKIIDNRWTIGAILKAAK